MSILSKNNSVKVHLLRPGFEYPENSFKHRDALYYPSKDVVFIATKQPVSHHDSVYTEIAIWEPDEIRLLGTLTLSVPENGGWVGYYPWDATYIRMPIATDLSSNSNISSCLDFARDLLAKNEESRRNSYLLRSQRSLPRSGSQIENDLFDNIDPTNSLLIRGLYHLIKCPLLLTVNADYPMFMEEAFINLQISIEASYQIFRQRICAVENPNPSRKDVFEYINSNFAKNESWVDYLEEQYEKWIETKHPMSAYGSAWAPPLLADDIYETYGTVISIYRHIVLGEPGGSSDYFHHI